MKRVYGWQPQPIDERDFKFLATLPKANLPKAFNLLQNMPIVYDQGSLGSCTANAIGTLVDYELNILPSRIFVYYNERAMIGTVNEDSGAFLRDGMKSINKLGVCEDELCPYVIEDFAKKPKESAYENALNYRTSSYKAVAQTENAIKSALVAGHPIAFGFLVKESFESTRVSKSGFYRPKPDEKIMGGHAVVICGYAGKNVLIRNSWGSKWGKGGNFTMPFSEVLDPKISSDFWIINSMI